MPICLVCLHYGPAQTPLDHQPSSSSAKCKATSSSLHPCPAPTEAPPGHPNPIALPHPPRQRLPSNGPIKTAPRKIPAHSCLIERGSPDRVLSFIRTDPVDTLRRLLCTAHPGLVHWVLHWAVVSGGTLALRLYGKGVVCGSGASAARRRLGPSELGHAGWDR